MKTKISVISVENDYVVKQVWEDIRRENMRLLVKKAVRREKIRERVAKIKKKVKVRS